MINAELAFESGARRALAGELEHQRMHAKLDRFDGGRRELVRRAKLQAAVDRGMDHDAARKRLVAVGVELPRFTQPLGDPGQVALGRENVRESPPALDRLGRAGEILACEERRREPVPCRKPDVQRLAHRAEHLAQARGLRGGNAERPYELLLAQTEELARRGRRAEHARGSGDVPADVVVAGVYGVADAALDLDAKRERVQEIGTADRSIFGECEDRGSDRSARMYDCLEMGVVEIEGVRRDAVHERGEHDVHTMSTSEHSRLRRP